MSTIRRLDLRGFLEGIEIPVISAVLQVVPNTPAMLTMQVIGTDAILDLPDRTVVHLFTKDIFEDDYNPDLNDYDLFYTGEVRAKEMVKQASGSRSAVLHCEDFSAYWDVCQQYVADFSNGGDAFWDRTSAFLGANKALFDNILRSVDLQLNAMINSKSVTRPETKGLLSGVLRMFERMGGVYKGTKRFRGHNDFFSAAELRLRIVDQIGATEKDTTSLRLLNHKVFVKWITNSIGSYGSLLSYRDLLKILFGYIFHEVAPNPLGKYNPGSMKTSYKKVVSVSEDAENIVAQAYDKLVDKSRIIVNKHNLLNMPGTAAGTHSTFKLYTQVEDLEALQNYINGFNALVARQRVAPLPKELLMLVKEASAAYGKGDMTLAKEKEALYFSRLVSGSAAYTFTKSKYKTVKTTRESRAQLITQIIYPNLFFAPPPRCNVIFPEMYMDFAYKQDMRNQITRMRIQLKCWLSGGSSTKGFSQGPLGTSLLGYYYYAPNIRGVNSKHYLGSTANMVRVLLPHERFSGIIPSIQTLGRVNFYVARQDEDYKKQGGGIPYVQRTTNFKFFLDRFASRTLSIVGPFNPYPVCGLPCLVIDRYSPATLASPYNTAETQYSLAKKPTQYLGRITQMQHSLIPLASTTSLVLSTVRTHNERDELLGATDLGEVKKSKQDRNRYKAVQGLKDMAQNMSNSVQAMLEDSLPTYKKYRLVLDHLAKEASRQASKAEAGKHHIVSKLYTRVYFTFPEAARALLADRAYQFRAILGHAATFLASIQTFVFEDYALDLKERIPMEEALRPTWYDRLYDNPRIGPDFYEPLIGCESLVDRLGAGNLYSDIPIVDQKATTVEHAVDQLVEAYGSIKRSGGDAVQFMRAYTRRPIAKFHEVMGEDGFHKYAYGDSTGFSDILLDPQLGVKNTSDTARKIDPKMDTRAERRIAVRHYVSELESGVVLA